MYEIRKKNMEYCGDFLEHHDKCSNFFDKVKNGERIYVCLDGDNVEKEIGFSDAYNEEFIQTNSVSFSVLNDTMISYDREMFEIEDVERLKTIYRPFFCGFSAQLELENYNYIQELKGNWYEGKIVSEESDYKSADDNVLELTGYLITSASPINKINKRLIIYKDCSLKQNVLDEINSVYDPTIFPHAANSEIQTALADAWGRCIPKTIDFYNVGHGNCDYIRSNHRRILYDVGYNYPMIHRFCNPKFPRATWVMRKIKPSIVIISHWDLDHFIGCAYADKDLFNVKWIAPGLVNGSDNASTNAMRVAHYLYKLGNLLLVDRNNGKQLIARINCLNNIKIDLWLGKGTSQYISQRNCEGLIIDICDFNQKFPHILLAGDVPYGCIPRCVLNRTVEYMHVPHHCSKMDLSELIKMNGSSKGEYAIISTNRKKDTSRSINCDDDHKTELEKKFEKVIFTIENAKKDDERNLSIRFDCRSKTVGFR